MNRKTRHDHIEASEIGQRHRYVVRHDRNSRLGREPLACGSEHGFRKIESNTSGVGASEPDERQEPAIPCADVKDSAHDCRKQLENGCLTFGPMRDAVGLRQVGQRVGRGRVFVQLRYSHPWLPRGEVPTWPTCQTLPHYP